jgi:hypothetical protein
LGNNHHHHAAGKPGLCELRKSFKDDAYWPPMDCKYLNIHSNNFKQSHKEQIKPTVQILVLAAFLLEHEQITFPEQPLLLPPDPKCRSATIISVNTPRGPPLV